MVYKGAFDGRLICVCFVYVFKGVCVWFGGLFGCSPVVCKIELDQISALSNRGRQPPHALANKAIGCPKDGEGRKGPHVRGEGAGDGIAAYDYLF